jgi:WD40 repeat protein
MLLSAGPITAESAAQVAELGQIELQDTTPTAMDWSPAGDVIAVAGDGIWLYSTSTPQATPLQVGSDAPVTALAFDQTGQMIAAGFADGAVRVLDAASVGGAVEAQATGGESINSVAVRPDGQEIAAGSSDGVGMWSASSGEPVDTVDADNSVGSVAFSPNGDLLAYGAGDGSIHLVDVASNEEVRVLENGHTDTIHDLEFSPDGSLLASAVADGSVRLWNVETGEELSTLDSDAVSVAFSPDGSVLASASGNTIDLWDVETRMKLAALDGHAAPVNDVAFSPTGEFLASVGEDGTLRLWGASFAAGA